MTSSGFGNIGRDRADELDVLFENVDDDVGVDASEVLGADVDVFSLVRGIVGREGFVGGALRASATLGPLDAVDRAVDRGWVGVKGPEAGRADFLDGSHREWRGRR